MGVEIEAKVLLYLLLTQMEMETPQEDDLGAVGAFFAFLGCLSFIFMFVWGSIEFFGSLKCF